ncbi:hypothetical protein DM02DRAFT_728590 [Periconia macrospinosa]|uniref:Uncharacterized protein n=1 Tax=Periconia macrospinosa TaxID=97972 RepID=A0A2V1DQ30_9PLEO|nr:hypothetical protein DM02DRAFT_728590 [Periconia macrospinosa]
MPDLEPPCKRQKLRGRCARRRSSKSKRRGRNSTIKPLLLPLLLLLAPRPPPPPQEQTTCRTMSRSSSPPTTAPLGSTHGLRPRRPQDPPSGRHHAVHGRLAAAQEGLPREDVARFDADAAEAPTVLLPEEMKPEPKPTPDNFMNCTTIERAQREKARLEKNLAKTHGEWYPSQPYKASLSYYRATPAYEELMQSFDLFLLQQRPTSSSKDSSSQSEGLRPTSSGSSKTVESNYTETKPPASAVPLIEAATREDAYARRAQLAAAGPQAPSTTPPPPPPVTTPTYSATISAPFVPNPNFAPPASATSTATPDDNPCIQAIDNEYATTAHFNRFNGQFQREGVNPEYHNDENKSHLCQRRAELEVGIAGSKGFRYANFELSTPRHVKCQVFDRTHHIVAIEAYKAGAFKLDKPPTSNILAESVAEGVKLATATIKWYPNSFAHINAARKYVRDICKGD